MIFRARRYSEHELKNMVKDAVYNNEILKKPGFITELVMRIQTDVIPRETNKDEFLTDNRQLQALIKRLEEVEISLGGPQKAYTIERKTRMFVDEIFKSICMTLSSSGRKKRR